MLEALSAVAEARWYRGPRRVGSVGTANSIVYWETYTFLTMTSGHPAMGDTRPKASAADDTPVSENRIEG